MIVACVLVDLDIGWENRGIEGIVISGVVTEFAHFIDFRDNVYYIKKFFQIFFGVGV